MNTKSKDGNHLSTEKKHVLTKKTNKSETKQSNRRENTETFSAPKFVFIFELQKFAKILILEFAEGNTESRFWSHGHAQCALSVFPKFFVHFKAKFAQYNGKDGGSF